MIKWSPFHIAAMKHLNSDEENRHAFITFLVMMIRLAAQSYDLWWIVVFSDVLNIIVYFCYDSIYELIETRGLMALLTDFKKRGWHVGLFLHLFKS